MNSFDAGARGWLYFDANSIGAMPKLAPARMARLLEQWRSLRRRGWSDADWLDAPRRLGDKLAPLIGARQGSVLVGDSTSVNLHKALAMAARLRAGRSEILTEAGTFPTDLYVAEQVARAHGMKLRRIEGPEKIAPAITRRTAVLYLSHTDYRTGYRHDLAALTKRAHAAGALTVWDLSHSAGAVATGVGRGGADFAVGCGYKYLCGGPGAPGYLYVAPRLQARLEPALQGWFGHAAPMDFEPRFRPARGIQRHAVGTPAVAGNVLLEAALDVFSKQDAAKLFAKHAALSQLLIDLAPGKLTLASPLDARRRGGFVAFRFRDAKKLAHTLEKHRVVASARPPDIVRFGLSPLYHSAADVRELARRLDAILAEASMKRYSAVLALLLAACAAGPAPISNQRIAEIVASPDRSAADRTNDLRRKPRDLLAFIGPRPGMVALDLSAGGGYTTELIARAVGPGGRVYGQSRPRNPDGPKPPAPEGAAVAAAPPPSSPQALAARAKNPAAGNITAVVRVFEDPVPPEAAASGLDLVTLMFNYHDLGWLKVDRARMNRAVFAALKPGGVYVIADHSGRPGTGISESGTLHRMEEAFLRREVEAAGFRLAAEGNFLRNPNDPRDRNTPEPPQPKDEFVLKFVKP